MYAIIKGNLFTNYTGSTVCTGLSVHTVVSSKEEARAILKELMDTETDLTIVINLETGLQQEDI